MLLTVIGGKRKLLVRLKDLDLDLPFLTPAKLSVAGTTPMLPGTAAPARATTFRVPLPSVMSSFALRALGLTAVGEKVTKTWHPGSGPLAGLSGTVPLHPVVSLLLDGLVVSDTAKSLPFTLAGSMASVSVAVAVLLLFLSVKIFVTEPASPAVESRKTWAGKARLAGAKVNCSGVATAAGFTSSLGGAAVRPGATGFVPREVCEFADDGGHGDADGLGACGALAVMALIGSEAELYFDTRLLPVSAT